MTRFLRDLKSQRRSSVDRKGTFNSILHSQNARLQACALPFRYFRLGLFSFIMLSLMVRRGAPTTLQSQDVISRIDNAQKSREQKLAGYTAIEHYTVRNSHFDQIAELTAFVRYEKELGKRYQILSRRGPQFLQQRVINRILKEDATLSRSSERPHTSL